MWVGKIRKTIAKVAESGLFDSELVSKITRRSGDDTCAYGLPPSRMAKRPDLRVRLERPFHFEVTVSPGITISTSFLEITLRTSVVRRKIVL